MDEDISQIVLKIKNETMTTNADKMKFIILGVVSTLFITSVIVSFFKPSQEISTLANVFMVTSGLVLGGSVANNFINKQDE